MANRFGGKIGIVDILMFIWWGYVLLRTYLLPGAPCYGEILTYTCLFLLYILLRWIDSSIDVPDKFYVWGILGYASYQLILGYYQLYSGTSHHYLYLVTGSFNNPGPYSASVAMGIVMALANMKQQTAKTDDLIGKAETVLCWGIVFLGCMMLSITFSRSAFVVVGGMFLYAYRKPLWRYRWILAFSAIILAAVLLYLKWGSAVGRVIIWWQTLVMWWAHPILGVGIGNFAGEYGCQLCRFWSDASHVAVFAPYADVTEHAFCDGLQIGAEQGILGAAVCYTIVGLTVKGLYEKHPTLCYGFAALLLFSLFSFPLQLLPYRVLCILFLAKGAQNKQLFSLGPWQTGAIGGMMAIGCLCCWELGVPYLKAHEEVKFLSGVSHQSFIPDYYRLLPYCHDDKRYLFNFAKLLQANKRYRDSNAMLRQGTKVSNDPMFWVLMGNNYKEQKQYDEAVRCYDSAFRHLPNRLYPLYQKMTTLKETNDTIRMKRVARQILEFQPKIPSPAIEKMKDAARNVAF